MADAIPYGAAALLSYLMGAVPFGLIIGRLRGVDVRLHGSRNIGATNVFRVVGKPWGILTFVADFLKGLLPVLFAPMAASRFGLSVHPEWIQLVCAISAVAGHNWPVYLRFRGGKGVATSTGALTGMAWPAVLAGMAVWIMIFALWRYVSLASILAATAAAGSAWWFYRSSGILIPAALTFLALLLIIRHHGNIRRLLAGTENRFPNRSPGTPPASDPTPQKTPDSTPPAQA
jgi:glycerol-3-phosphate acyltransferase PlsY